MKKTFLSIICLITLFFMIGCERATSSTNALLTNSKDVYGFEAVSSITLLNAMSTDSKTTPLSVKPLSNSYSLLGYNNDLSEEKIDEINKYLGIMEQMLADGEPISVVDETSDRIDYTNKLVISTKDLNLNVYTYLLYYNEVTNDKLNDDELNDEDDDDFDDEDEIKNKSLLEGIMVVGDKEYLVYGKQETEDDETKIEFTSKIDDKNWVSVKQKTEDDESKFEYSLCENGVISVTEMKLEKENNETKLKLELKEGENKGEYQFKIEEEEGQKVIKIEIQDETSKFEAKVYVIEDPLTGEVCYEYRMKDSNKSYKRERKHAHDFDDDDTEEDDE